MAASFKKYAYALTGANGLPDDANITKEEGAALPVEVTPGDQIDDGDIILLYKGTRKVLGILSHKNVVTATGEEVADDHGYTLTADKKGVLVTAAADIPDTTHFKLLLLLGY